MALETHDLLRFLWSVVCKCPVINVTLLTLKIATQNTRLMGYFPIVLMKFLNTNLRHLRSVFLLVRVTYVTFFYEIAYYDFIDYKLE